MSEVGVSAVAGRRGGVLNLLAAVGVLALTVFLVIKRRPFQGLAQIAPTQPDLAPATAAEPAKNDATPMARVQEARNDYGAPGLAGSSNGAATALSVGYYAGLVVILLGAFTKLWPALLPPRIGTAIDYNSEGFLYALVLGAWLQFARPRLVGSTRGWLLAATAAAACIGLGIFQYLSNMPSWFKTLNEPFIALGVVILYLQARRSIPKAMAFAVPVLVLLLVVGGGGNAGVVGNLSEAMGFIFLVPLAFDVIDRGILDGNAVTQPLVRYCWYAFLVVVFVGVSLLMRGGELSGWAYGVEHYINRSHECIIGIVLLEGYFAVALKRTGHPATQASALQGLLTPATG